MSDEGNLFGGIVFGLIVGCFFMAFVPMRCSHYEQQQEAVNHGAAIWEVDQASGITTFKWKEETK